MQIKEAKEKQHQLNRNIESLIAEFEQETGLELRNIDMIKCHTDSLHAPKIIKTEVEF